MKKLSKEAKFNLKTIFGSLISNRCAIEAGKSLPFWSSILVALLAVGMAITPIIVNAAKTNGSDILKGNYSYGIERKMAVASVEMKQENIRLEVDANHMLTFYKNDVARNADVQGVELLSSYTVVKADYTEQYDIRSYFVNDYNEKTYAQYINETMQTQYLLGTTTKKSDTDPKDSKYYIPTSVFYYEKGFVVYAYKYGTTTAAFSFAGDFVNVEPTELNKTILTVDGYVPTTIDDISKSGYEAGVLDNLKTLFDKSFLEIKGRNLLYSSTIYSAVYLGLIILLGLLTFFITRGKRNFNNYLKIYQCLYIACWVSFTPGLLALILGFALSNYAVMMFILFMGVRTMWLTMKQLAPTGAPAK